MCFILVQSHLATLNFVLLTMINKIYSICLCILDAAKPFETYKKLMTIIGIEQIFEGVQKPFLPALYNDLQVI